MKSLPWTTVELMWVAILMTVGVPYVAAAESAGTRNVVRQAGPGRWALLIGVDQYAWAKSLDFCGADMQALGDQLASSGFPRDHVYLLHDKAAESVYRPLRANIARQLKLVLGLVERGDLVVVAFSGHGVHLQGKSFLCPGDANLDDPQTLISMDSVYDFLQKSPAALKLLLVDACRNDPRLDGEKGPQATEGQRQFAVSLEQPPKGILAMTSCAAGEKAREDKELGHGVFMHFLLEGLGGKADVNSNGGVSLMESYLYARDKTKTYVARKFVDSQRPGLKGEIEDDFDLTQVLGPAKELTNSLGMKLALIPAGEFMMGSPESDSEAYSDEKPQHSVRITKPFYLGVTEVTQAQYKRVMGANPSNFEGSWLPVEEVSWEDAVEFCRKLSEKEGRTYRLPTEAEWEYACRAGSTTKWSFGDDESRLGEYAWHTGNSDRNPHAVGEKKPNAWGLYDMHGNVCERCADWKQNYASTAVSDPTGPTTGSDRVFRGGGWDYDPRACRSAIRLGTKPGGWISGIGFRVASSSVDASSR